MLTYSNGRLCIEAQAITDLAGQRETPFFLVSERQLRDNYRRLAGGMEAAGEKTALRYCAKTNNEAAILEILAGCGCQLLASHSAEALLALACGFAPTEIAYQRPVLSPGEVRTMLEKGITLIHAFRMSDLDVIEDAASEAGVRVRVILRLCDDFMHTFVSPFHFLSRRLGFREDLIPQAAVRVQNSSRMTLHGINCYGGTQRESLATYRILLRKLAMLAGRLRADCGIHLQEINLGGGIPSPSLRRSRLRNLLSRWRDASVQVQGVPSLEETGSVLASMYREETRRAGLDPQPALVAEPGRAIVANAVVLVTAVQTVAEPWLFLDASRNFLGESPFLFTRHIWPAIEPLSPDRVYYHISGCTLNTMDILDLRRRLPAQRPGDLLVFSDAGAYSISRAIRYAGLSPAIYLLRESGEIRPIRRPENLTDLTAPMQNIRLRSPKSG